MREGGREEGRVRERHIDRQTDRHTHTKNKMEMVRSLKLQTQPLVTHLFLKRPYLLIILK